MRKISAFLIIFSIIFSCLALNSCQDVPDEFVPDAPIGDNGIIVPEGTYTRELVYYKDLVYARPDIEAVTDKISAVSELINGGVSFEDGVNAITAIEADYVNVTTMRTMAEIGYMKSSNDKTWSAEYNYVNKNYPQFIKSVEDMLVACAQSEHAERYENEYFGYSLDPYKDGGIYTNQAVELMEYEAKYEKLFTDLSESTVELLYNGKKEPFTYIIELLKEEYGEGTQEFEAEYNKYLELFYEEYASQSRDIFLALLRVRRLLAEELGYKSYTEYAYSEMGYHYTPEDMEKLVDSFRKNVYPVYSTLYNRAFRSFFTMPSLTVYRTTKFQTSFTDCIPIWAARLARLTPICLSPGFMILMSMSRGGTAVHLPHI